MALIQRRGFLFGIAGGAALGRLPGWSNPAAAQGATPTAGDPYAEAVDAGLAHFRPLAEEHARRAEALRDAIAAGDGDRARRAYIATRPPYEEIEVLAAGFPETDEAIDARPYAIPGGEISPDYVSVHRIESLLFRDNDLAAALPFAEGFVGSARALQRDLERREAFAAESTFAGMLALSEEIASKKISSEEETWSDQSLLIFVHNWRGIASQYAPFAPLVEAADPAVAAEIDEAVAAAFATVAAWPPVDGVFPPYSGVPPAARGEIVRASYRLRDGLGEAMIALGLG